jgi:hypothetical protein
MQQTMICKSCGFILTGDKIPDACPACGVPARMFIPHDERISPSRKRLLALDLHPVIVHFTQAYTATVLVLSWLAPLLRGAWSARAAAVLVVMAYALPVTVVAASAAGMLDGKIRFRRVTTPLLVRKMALGSVLFLLTCGILACVVRDPDLSRGALLVMGLLSLPAMACASVLGFWGVSLLNCRFPG